MKVFEKNVRGYRSRWYVSIFNSYCEERIYVYRIDGENPVDTLKKVWKHYNTRWGDPYDSNTVTAIAESEDGSYTDMGQWWSIEPYVYCEEHDIPLPDTLPFY